MLSIIFHLLFTVELHASTVTKLDQALLNEYLKIQKEFSQKVCSLGTEKKFEELNLKYKGDGNFIPVTIDQKVDIKSIQANIPFLKEKIEWIQSESDRLSKIENLAEIKGILKRIDNEVQLLQQAKKDHFLAKDPQKKMLIEKEARNQFNQLLKEVELLKQSASFLLSFKFPLNHLSMRAEYDKFKVLPGKESRLKSNMVYLFRRVVQDGSFDSSFSRNDSVIRASFDTLYLSINKDKDRSFLTENERSDFKYVIGNFNLLVDLGPEKLIARMKEWKQRSERSLEFYQDLADGKKIKVGTEQSAEEISSVLTERAKTLSDLKEFVLKKEAEAYVFWAQKSDLFQYLYAMETILYAEVGRIDAPDALERRDVGQVVINRYFNSKYNMISAADSIFTYLPKDLDLKNSKWLNVLFKESEFSFTYFYIPGNLHIYCPDMSKVGQFLRRENSRIALELFNNPKLEFQGLRYFSRMSMFGRIEMDTLWDDYKAIGEKPGKPAKNAKRLYELFKQDRYKYLYHFEDKNKDKTYLVVEMKGKTYVVNQKDPKAIYYYRNPHQFRYFAPSK